MPGVLAVIVGALLVASAVGLLFAARQAGRRRPTDAPPAVSYENGARIERAPLSPKAERAAFVILALVVAAGGAALISYGVRGSLPPWAARGPIGLLGVTLGVGCLVAAVDLARRAWTGDVPDLREGNIPLPFKSPAAEELTTYLWRLLPPRTGAALAAAVAAALGVAILVASGRHLVTGHDTRLWAALGSVIEAFEAFALAAAVLALLAGLLVALVTADGAGALAALGVMAVSTAAVAGAYALGWLDGPFGAYDDVLGAFGVEANLSGEPERP
jgi:hypothetical protein